MKRRPKQDIEIFSLSAIDLFAAAMGAFALLTIVLMPYYQKEVQERTPDNALADLARAAETSAVKSEETRKALAEKRSAAANNVSKIKSDADKLLAELRAAQAALKEKKALAERAIIVPEPIATKPAPTPAKTITAFSFLGMKTNQDDVVISLDMNRCMKGHEASIERAVQRIINSLQDNHALKITGFQHTDTGPKLYSWPSNGRLQRMVGQTRNQSTQFAKSLTTRFGGSASMLHAFRELLAGPGQAIFLVSDGLPNPKFNNGLTPTRLVHEITRLNAGRKEIHTVVVGNYFDYDGTIEFMEALAARNNGQFMALASSATGVCD